MAQSSEIMTPQLILQHSDSTDASQVYKVRLSDKKISKIEGLESVSQLRYLNLSYNFIRTIQNLERLHDLRELYLNANALESLRGVDENKTLQVLNVAQNQITQIDNLSNLIRLQTLDLSCNRLTSLQGLESLRELRTLSLSKNLIKEISFIPSLPKLQELFIDHNSIEKLPVKLFENAPTLALIDISHNSLNTLDFLQPLKNLEKLYAAHNQITSLQSLANVYELVELVDLSQNKIEDVSKLNTHFPNAYSLDLKHNDVCLIDDLYFLELMDSVTEIDLRDNPCCAVDEEEFVTEMRKRFEFLEVINGREIMRAGQRFTNTIRELAEHMEEKERLLKYVMEFDSQEDEKEFARIKQEYTLDMTQFQNPAQLLSKSMSNFHKNGEKDSLASRPLEILPTKIKRVGHEGFLEQPDFEQFLLEQEEKMQQIRCKYQAQKEINDKRTGRGVYASRLADRMSQSQSPAKRDGQTRATRKAAGGLYDEEVELETTAVGAVSDSFQVIQDQSQNSSQLLNSAEKTEQMKKLEKKFRSETIAPHEVRQALKKIEKNVIIKSHRVNIPYLKQQVQNLTRTQAGQFSAVPAQQSILTEISDIKKKMGDEQFLKTLGTDLCTRPPQLGTANLGVVLRKQSAIEGNSTLMRPRKSTPLTPAQSNLQQLTTTPPPPPQVPSAAMLANGAEPQRKSVHRLQALNGIREKQEAQPSRYTKSPNPIDKNKEGVLQRKRDSSLSKTMTTPATLSAQGGTQQSSSRAKHKLLTALSSSKGFENEKK